MSEFENKGEIIHYIIMTLGMGLTLMFGFTTWVFSSISADLSERIAEKDAQIEQLSIESVRYKSMYEEVDRTLEHCKMEGDCCE